MVKKSKSKNDEFVVPALKPSDPEALIVGGEPGFLNQPSDNDRKITIVKSLNWYNRFYDSKKAKDLFCDYVKSNHGHEISDTISKISENNFILSICWLSRMSMRGLLLLEDEKQKIDEHLANLLDIPAKKEKTETKTKINVQEILREKASEVAGEIEGIFDDWLKSGAKFSGDKLDVIRLLHDKNILPQHMNFMLEIWKHRKEEFEKIGTDKDLAEGYSNLTKTQVKSCIKWCDALLSEFGGYVTVKKATRAPRKRKAISPEKQVSKLQFLRSFDELKLQSVPPAKIIGANEVWAYDTGKRKLWYFIADAHAGTLSVKGTSILGYDSTLSGAKTIRKPLEQLKDFMSLGKPASRKFFKDIKAIQAPLKGRTNPELIILKVY